MKSLEEVRHLWAEVDINNLEHNFREIKRYVGNDCKLMAVLKANGYGHGATEVAKVFSNADVDYLAVAMLSEGVELRKNRINSNILILGYTPVTHYDKLIEYGIIPTIFDYEQAKALSELAVSKDKTVKIHIKVDTGMGRIGLPMSDSTVDIIKKIYNLPNIVVDGIFSHFAKADESDKTFSYIQLERFNSLIGTLENEGVNIRVKHIANSAGTIDIKESHLDMVRPGLILYGLYPSSFVKGQNLDLKPVMTLKSRITYIKEVDSGFGVGYGHKFITDRKTKIATIPMGYADGLPKYLSSKLKITVKGKEVDILGSICMDQFMIDVTEIDDISVEDEVVIFGHKKDYPIIENGINLGSMNYELLAMLGRRIPRIYKYNNQVINIKDYIED